MNTLLIFFTLMITPQALMDGSTMHLICRVSHDADNRNVRWGVEGVAVSGVSMEGDHAPTVYDRWIQHVPCGVSEAFCEVKKVTGATKRIVRPFQVTGCESNEVGDLARQGTP